MNRSGRPAQASDSSTLDGPFKVVETNVISELKFPWDGPTYARRLPPP